MDDDDLSYATETGPDEIPGVHSDLSKMSDVPDESLEVEGSEAAGEPIKRTGHRPTCAGYLNTQLRENTRAVAPRGL